MAKERLNSISLHQEMQQSYLEYAMSVIVGRALPDARDGLKPVQRRILFAMHELGLTPERPFRKCARVVGDVLGKYHPHGDQAVYDALVRQVQSFTCRYPLLDGHGNFGSIDDDPPAAMRYTETRLAKISHEAILNEIDSETVQFSPNFDGSQQEPNVLPAQLPLLILNGCSGIAVGMATNIPPHNLNEIIDALIELIKKPNTTKEKLLEIVPGPDFPTGGEILLTTGVKETYLKGKGSIPMRGIAHIEEVNPGKGKHRRNAIIVTELPYQLSKSGWIEKVAELVNNGKINGIADIRDESDRDGMRVLIEIRRDSDPNKILKDLYQKTSLHNNFGATLLALVNGQPVQLSLKELLTNFLEFRETTIIKRTKFALKKTKNREEIVEGLLTAIDNLRSVINLLENANDANEAKSMIISKFQLNEKQADGILGMPLRKLTNLEKEGLRDELIELKTKRDEFELILNNRNELMKIMIKELKILKKKFGSERKTKLIEGGDKLIAEKNANQRPNIELQRQQAFDALNKDGHIIINEKNEVKIVSQKYLSRYNLDESSELDDLTISAKLIWPIVDKPKILIINKLGKVGLLKWEFFGQQPGPIEKFLPSGIEKNSITNILIINQLKNASIALLSSDGRLKRLSINEILEISNRSSSVLKLKEGIFLKSGIICTENDFLIIVTDIGRILKVKVTEDCLPIMGKNAQGPVVIKVFPGESIKGIISAKNNCNESIVMITKKGTLIKFPIDSIRTSNRGGMGIMGLKINSTKKFNDEISVISKDNNLINIRTSTGRNQRISLDELQAIKVNVENKNYFRLEKSEKILESNNLIKPND